MLEFAILGLLHEGPMHGYELRKELAAKLGSIRAAISYGSLYPTLRRLQSAGYLTEAGETPPTTPEVPTTPQGDQGGGRQMFRWPGGAKLQTIIDVVNSLGASPDDIMAILQALDQAGAIEGELVVI